MEDIYLLPGEKQVFVIINDHVIETIDNHFTLRFPPIFKKKCFHFPELIKVNRIPSTYAKSSIYFTIGVIIFAVFFKTYPVWNVKRKEWETEGEEDEEDEGENGKKSVIASLEKIRGTKIYYFLKRCFQGELFFI
jgi:hypothetical protein